MLCKWLYFITKKWKATKILREKIGINFCFKNYFQFQKVTGD